jgi:8-oxo-dGTP pyrophosphatase MutT (NUDIX family)
MRNKNQRRNARLRRRGRHVHCQYGKGHWGKFGAAGVLIECDGYVLVTQRSMSLYNGRAKWSIPGGARNARWEDPINGAMRELLEETSGLDIWDLHVIGYDTVECDCGWTYTTYRLQASRLHDVYVNDYETRRIAWAPISMVENMDLLPSFARYWKTHSRMVAKESPSVDHAERFVDAYRYELDDDVTQAYYDKKGESRLERKYSSYTSYSYYPAGSYSNTSYKSNPKTDDGNSTYRTTGKYGTTYDPTVWANAGYGDGYYGDGGYSGGSNTPEFRQPNYGNSNWGNSYTSRATQDRYNADNGFHHQLSLDEEWDVEPTDDEMAGAEAAREVDLDNLVDADWETINDSVLDAIDRAMVSVGID